MHAPPLWTVTPFAIMLVAIALLPLLAEHFWHSNRNKLLVSLALGLPMAAYLYANFGLHPLRHALLEYFSFIVLLGSLYVISGNVLVAGDIQATPRNNMAFLGLGAVLASLIGTTGASMLLIRPLLSTNSERRHVVHTIVFFIFIVSNTGGCLTPLGDPPLFLGYLRGVPFSWTLNLWPEWLMVNGSLLVIYGIWDTLAYRREALRDKVLDRTTIRPIRIQGQKNLLLLLGVILCVARAPSIDLEAHQFLPYREIWLLLLGGLSFWDTDKGIREANQFDFGAIFEVAALFIGIFITMTPALLILSVRGAELGIREPLHFFWAAGFLSSFLDNAPTYATFFELGRSVTAAQGLAEPVAGVARPLLEAVSLGAVFMGANTYIGNGPNFMVRSIAESRGVRMPSFFGYMAYSGALLIPLFLLLSLVIFG